MDCRVLRIQARFYSSETCSKHAFQYTKPNNLPLILKTCFRVYPLPKTLPLIHKAGLGTRYIEPPFISHHVWTCCHKGILCEKSAWLFSNHIFSTIMSLLRTWSLINFISLCDCLALLARVSLELAFTRVITTKCSTHRHTQTYD